MGTLYYGDNLDILKRYVKDETAVNGKNTSDVDPDGQVWLPMIPAPCSSRVADVCLQKLCRAFSEQCPPVAAPTLSTDLDDLSLACLLVSVEWGRRSPETTSEHLAGCLDKVAGRFWGDLLVWKLALEFCRFNPRAAYGLGELTVNLDHHNSAIRMWMLHLAWSVRHRLNLDDATRRLLNNVSNTLSGWDAALGLCRALFETEDHFWIFAKTFVKGVKPRFWVFAV